MNETTTKNEEYLFDENVIISQTDIKGVITYANRSFCKVSGYEKDELTGKLHNIIRHPDMPKKAFEKMWETIQNGQVWNGLLKNLRKDKEYYWIDVEILPIRDSSNKITGYISVGKTASRKDIQENEKIYQKMLESED